MKLRNRFDSVPRKINQAIRPHVQLIRNSERTTGDAPEVISQCGQRNGQNECGRKSCVHECMPYGRSALTDSPPDERNYYWNAEEQPFERTRAGQEAHPQCKENRIPHSLIFLYSWKGTEHQGPAEGHHRSSPV